MSAALGEAAGPYDDQHGCHRKAGTTDITEIGQELWSFLTGKGAMIEYSFEDMSVEVPKLRSVGPLSCSPRPGSP